MKYIKLKNEEKEILNDFENDKYERLPQAKKEKAKYQSIAKLTLQKTKHINIRLSEKDIQKLKIKAIEKGIPYQTLVTSILHQYADGQKEIL
jgi:predicted DNA binding CopG/RHH family protein